MEERSREGTVVAVYATFPNMATAEAIGRRLVEDGLVACVNLLPSVTSIYRWKGAVEQAGEVAMIAKTTASRAEAAIAAIAERGPDDRGFWSEDGATLGNCRLAILDLSPAGHLPMQSADGRYVLAYNGEIYNFQASSVRKTSSR